MATELTFYYVMPNFPAPQPEGLQSQDGQQGQTLASLLHVTGQMNEVPGTVTVKTWEDVTVEISF